MREEERKESVAFPRSGGIESAPDRAEHGRREGARETKGAFQLSLSCNFIRGNFFPRAFGREIVANERGRQAGFWEERSSVVGHAT